MKNLTIGLLPGRTLGMLAKDLGKYFARTGLGTAYYQDDVAPHIDLHKFVVDEQQAREALERTRGLVKPEEVVLEPETLGVSEDGYLVLPFAENEGMFNAMNVSLREFMDIAGGSKNLVMRIGDRHERYCMVMGRLLYSDEGLEKAKHEVYRKLLPVSSGYTGKKIYRASGLELF